MAMFASSGCKNSTTADVRVFFVALFLESQPMCAMSAWGSLRMFSRSKARIVRSFPAVDMSIDFALTPFITTPYVDVMISAPEPSTWSHGAAFRIKRARSWSLWKCSSRSPDFNCSAAATSIPACWLVRALLILFLRPYGSCDFVLRASITAASRMRMRMICSPDWGGRVSLGCSWGNWYRSASCTHLWT
jgi:hypothetical protein